MTDAKQAEETKKERRVEREIEIAATPARDLSFNEQLLAQTTNSPNDTRRNNS
jgi:hypothetical protein